jgi:hypothetical protein
VGGRVAHHPALANLLGASFELRLDQRDDPGVCRNQPLHRRQHQPQRDK